MSDPRERIRLLLALAKSSQHPSEVRSARKKAGELMKRHSLNRKEVFNPPPAPAPRSTTPNADVLAHLIRLRAMEEDFNRKHQRRMKVINVLEISMIILPIIGLVIGVLNLLLASK